MTLNLDAIEARLNSLKLSSDDHGHDCTALREYCESELIFWADGYIPNLIQAVRELQDDRDKWRGIAERMAETLTSLVESIDNYGEGLHNKLDLLASLEILKENEQASAPEGK